MKTIRSCRCHYCQRDMPRDDLERGRCRPGLDCGAHRLIGEARASGNPTFAAGIEAGLKRHGPWWEKREADGG